MPTHYTYAYLVLRIDKKTARVRFARIVNEWPVTEHGDDDGTWALLTKSAGFGFSAARHNLAEQLRTPHYRWLRPLMET